MKELQPDVLNDYEHRILRGIGQHEGEDGFPALAAFGVERKGLEDYLYEYQRILDSPGSQKAQLTKYGIVAVIPVIILSAFPESMLPWGKWSLFAGLGIGIALALVLKGLSVLSVRHSLRRLRADNEDIAAYADAVEHFIAHNS